MENKLETNFILHNNEIIINVYKRINQENHIIIFEKKCPIKNPNIKDVLIEIFQEIFAKTQVYIDQVNIIINASRNQINKEMIENEEIESEHLLEFLRDKNIIKNYNQDTKIINYFPILFNTIRNGEEKKYLFPPIDREYDEIKIYSIQTTINDALLKRIEHILSNINIGVKNIILYDEAITNAVLDDDSIKLGAIVISLDFKNSFITFSKNNACCKIKPIDDISYLSIINVIAKKMHVKKEAAIESLKNIQDINSNDIIKNIFSEFMNELYKRVAKFIKNHQIKTFKLHFINPYFNNSIFRQEIEKQFINMELEYLEKKSHELLGKGIIRFIERRNIAIGQTKKIDYSTEDNIHVKYQSINKNDNIIHRILNWYKKRRN